MGQGYSGAPLGRACPLTTIVRGKSAFFRRTPWLRGVPASELDRLIRVSDAHRVGRGGAIWDPADAADTVIWVRSGCVRVERAGEGGRVLILRFHGRGDVFGLAALYSDRTRGTSAIAHDECVVFTTPVAELEEVVRAHGDIGLRFSDRLIARQRQLEARLADVVFTPVKERLLALLAQLAVDFGVRDSRGVIVDLRLTHRELGELVGTTRETISLTLVRLRKAGWIATEDRRVVLLRPADLGVDVRARRRDV